MKEICTTRYCWINMFTLTRSLRYGISSPLNGEHCSMSWTQELDNGHQPQRWVWTQDSHVDCWLHCKYMLLIWLLLSSGQRLQVYFFFYIKYGISFYKSSRKY